MNPAPTLPAFGVRALIPLLIMVLTLADCAEPTAPQQGTGSLLPLAVGNRWIWQATTYNPAGETTGSRLDTMSILAAETVGSTTYYQNDFGSYYYVAQGSVYLYFPPDQSFLAIKDDALPGERFQFDTTRAGMGDSPCDTLFANRLLLSTSQTFETPAGRRLGYTFTEQRECVSDPDRYIRQDSSVEGFVRGIGPVITLRYRRNGTQWYHSQKSELISYRVN